MLILPVLLAFTSVRLAASLSAQNDMAGGGDGSVLDVCKQLEKRLSSDGKVFYPGTSGYDADVSRPANVQSRQPATCSVEPGNENDVVVIMTTLRQFPDVLFGVLGGGHAFNPGFSSTRGVLVSLNRLRQFKLHSNFPFGRSLSHGDSLQSNASSMQPLSLRSSAHSNDHPAAEVDVGPGWTWDELYNALDPYGLTAIGGRAATVGVPGLLLGGGYSFLSNLHGLAVDNVVSYTVVSPKDSSISVVDARSDPDLFYALKGGGNNFGIVTNFRIKAYRQGPVYAGIITFKPGHADQVRDTAVNFAQNNKDPNAVAMIFFDYDASGPSETCLLFFNGDHKPSVFDAFLSIPAAKNDFKRRSYADLVESTLPSVSQTDGTRTLFSTVSFQDLSDNVTKANVAQRDSWGPALLRHDPHASVSYLLEPYLPSYWDQATPSAYEHSPSHAVFPLTIQYSWTDPDDDDLFTNTLLKSTAQLDSDVGGGLKYPNYAAPHTPLKDMYADVDRLKQLRMRYDPDGLMLRAGGWKFV